MSDNISETFAEKEKRVLVDLTRGYGEEISRLEGLYNETSDAITQDDIHCELMRLRMQQTKARILTRGTVWNGQE